LVILAESCDCKTCVGETKQVLKCNILHYCGFLSSSLKLELDLG
jgi:hypothetical protein